MQVSPEIEKFVRANPGPIIDLEKRPHKILAANVIRAVKGCDSPTERAFGNDRTTLSMDDANLLAGHEKLRATNRAVGAP